MSRNTLPTQDDLIVVKVEVKESIIYEDLDEIGKDQEYEYLDAWTPYYVQVLSEGFLKDEPIKGMDSYTNSKTIFFNGEYKFKRGDIVRFYGHEEYLVQGVKISIDPQYAKVIKLFPNSKRKYELQTIDLKE